ncbi:MAG TPA: hypothetical protein VH165_11395, partial [Kofleriaceae bacterium]|nr:hypothetical protein [Kofleriaceae bacterium]
MALLRITALAVALGACGTAGADPAPPAPATSPAAPAGVGLAMPAHWKPLPPIAAALAAAAKADGVAIDGADAWGDPAAGCYTVRLALHGGNASTTVLADQVLEGLQAGAAPTATGRAAGSPGAAGSPSASGSNAVSGSSGSSATAGSPAAGSSGNADATGATSGAPGTTGVPANPRTAAPAITFSELVKPTGTDRS